MKKYALSLLLLLLSASLLPQAAEPDANWYDTTAKDSIKKENYEYAVKILKEGIRAFPREAALNRRLADLYFEKELYSLALSEYLATDRKEPQQFETMDRIQICYSLLNEEESAIACLEQMLSLFPMPTYPDTYYAVQDLGWLYFKTHRLNEAETLLKEHLALRGKGDSRRNLQMTLATIYAGMYAYQESQANYLAAIEEALDYEDTHFASVCYYNLALLEMDFYNFNSAAGYCELAIQNYDRATGHLARGELSEMQLDYSKALEEYEKGLALEYTPMTNINLASLYSTFGLLDKALVHAREVYESRDLSWLANFGTDKQQHMMQMHEILADIYCGLKNREKRLPRENMTEAFAGFIKSLGYKLKEYYHRQNFKALSLATGQDMLRKSQLLDAYLRFHAANEAYPKVALKYLHLARDFEEALTPRAAPYYLMEEGKLLHDPASLQQAAEQFDPFWEKRPLFENLLAQVALAPPRSAEARTTLAEAYALNPGGLPAAGYGVPLQLELELEGKMQKRGKWLQQALKKAGSQLAPQDGPFLAEGYRYTLRIRWQEGQDPSFSLLDRQTGRVLISGSADPGTGSPKTQTYQIVRWLLLEQIYRPRQGVR